MLVGTFGLSYMVALSTLETNPEIVYSNSLEQHPIYDENPGYINSNHDIEII
jgi:hypothetical protein